MVVGMVQQKGYGGDAGEGTVAAAGPWLLGCGWAGMRNAGSPLAQRGLGGPFLTGSAVQGRSLGRSSAVSGEGVQPCLSVMIT